jgi:hypothetical protein
MRVSHAHLKLTEMMRIQKIRCIRYFSFSENILV